MLSAMFAGSTAACRGKVRSLVPLCRRLSSDMPGSPSPESPDLRPDTEKQRRPKKDPSDCSVLLFPGQGSQFVGMGRGLLKYPNVKEMFQVARKILGYDLLSLCLEGPEAELMKTVHCQPAVFITSLAAVERLHHQNPKVGVFSSLQMKRASASLLWRLKGKICLFSHLKKMKLKLFQIMHANILLYIADTGELLWKTCVWLQSRLKDTQSIMHCPFFLQSSAQDHMTSRHFSPTGH